MKEVLIPIVLVVVFLAATLFLSVPGGTESQPSNASFYASVQPVSAGIADAGKNKTAYVVINTRSENALNGKVKWLWLEGKPVYGARLLSYPTTGKKTDSFKSALLEELASYGIRAQPASLSEVSSLRGTIIIIATGRMPSELLKPGALEALL